MTRVRTSRPGLSLPLHGTVSRRGPRPKRTGSGGRARTTPALVLLATLLAIGCAGAATNAYKLYPGPARPPEELAVLSFGERVSSLRVDGLLVAKSDYGRIELLPGPHEINWETQFTVSPMVNAAGRDEIAARTTVELEAGHEYTANSDRTTGPGYTMRWWLEDTTTGVVVAGRR